MTSITGKMILVRRIFAISILFVVTVFIALYLQQYLPGAELLEEQQAEDRRNDKQSPQYQFARTISIAVGEKILQYDGVPSVRVGWKRGYRILLGHEIPHNLRDNDTEFDMRYTVDLVLFPSRRSKPLRPDQRLRRIRSLRSPQLIQSILAKVKDIIGTGE